MGSFLLTSEVAQRAIDLARPMVAGLVAGGVTQKPGDLHVVVLDPAKPYPIYDFEEVVLAEMGIGNPKPKYKDVARSKARVVWSTGHDSLFVQQFLPHLLEFADTKWGGGVIRDQIVVAVSGLEEFNDILVSEVVAAYCKALCVSAMRDILRDNAVTFLGAKSSG